MKTSKIFQFTLVLKRVNDNMFNLLENNLFEAGCDDALINYRNGAVYLEFDREAQSFDKAVISAIKNVESSAADIEVASVAPENLVTESEIAKRLNKPKQTVSLWIKGERRKLFPHPVMRLAEKSPLWSWSEVAAWLFQNKLIKNKEIVENAIFIVNINAVLEGRDLKNREVRRQLERVFKP